ncbi:Beta-glucanase, GH16 family [Colwellia chukchiensis]|uniref:Beta-glucanase, GH16 family n=1 Tax=Colwellia chukchiensis TaxID=641665 RepID=A0A1H7Q904_9GAMM|nr:Beta-glucanase, GH16 family [Colwellia chukchiensis]
MIKTAKNITGLLALLASVTLVGCGGSSAETKTNTDAVNPQQPVSDWQMVWSDEFDGTSINTSNWTHEINCWGGGNQEKQCYTDSEENSYLKDGKLHLVALPAAAGAELPYTSARMITRYKADFKYGRIEIKAKLPSGQGSWPAFWMMPTDESYGEWPKSGEIDILEAVNLGVTDAEGKAENHIHGTLHYGKSWPDNSSSGKGYSLADGVNPADDFHTYAIEWQEGEIRWYMDDYLYATQRQSKVRYNSKDEAVGLAHRGWFTEYYDQVTGELTTFWDTAPFDKEFYLILNFAVGGNWPENVNALGVDASAFHADNKFEVDYVRVYQCQSDPETGKGCETVRPGYDSADDALVEGKAPIPSPPSVGVAQNLTIFSGTINPNWPAWDCCGGSTPTLVSDVEQGDVMEFYVGAEPTVNGFISRDTFIDDPAGQASPFDASPLIATGKLAFDMKVVSMPNSADAEWVLKVESQEGSTAVDMLLAESLEGAAPVAGEWQRYSFSLQSLADAGLDLSAIDVVMIFSTWGAGEGAVYQVTNLTIAGDTGASPQVVLFEDAQNPSWPMWDCCGGSTPMVETDDEAHGAVAEFSIGAEPTVMGFISREGNTDSPAPFDGTSILANGVIQFEMKVVTMPNDASATWVFKVEADNNTSAVELPLSSSVEGVVPVAQQWQTYTFKLADLANAGLDVSAIDVIMIFPAWGTGEGAVYRVDNAKIYDPNASTGFNGHVLFADDVKEQWSIWDCCGGTTPTLENDDTEHGMTAEFVIGASPTVMGLLADDDVYLDASSLLNNGVMQFEMKVISAPNDADAVWKFKIEAGDAASAVELDLSASEEGAVPVVGQWQTYTFTLQSLFDAGLDLSAIDVIMVFPAWGSGEGAVYRLDNVMIYDPSSVPTAQGLTLYDNAQHPEWPIWDCCGGSTPTEETDDAEHGMVAEFVIGSSPTVMGFLANEGVYFDASALQDNGVVRFEMKVLSAPNDANAVWKFKIEAGDTTSAVELDLTASQEGAAPVVGQWQTYTFALADLFAGGLDTSEIDVIMVFPAWGTGEGAVYRLDNVAITAQ